MAQVFIETPKSCYLIKNMKKYVVLLLLNSLMLHPSYISEIFSQISMKRGGRSFVRAQMITTFRKKEDV